VTFTSTKVTQGGNWLTEDPSNGTVSPGSTLRIVVQPVIANLSAGTYSGTISFQFSDGSLASVGILLILKDSTLSSRNTRDATTGCVPAKLFPALTGLPSQFSVPAAWPVSLQADVVDDCGNFLNQGSVVASFSNGDPPLSMLPLGAGRWTATWLPAA